MKKKHQLLTNQSKMINIIVGLIGVILVLLAIILIASEIVKNILLSIGCSLIATSIATWLTSYYMSANNDVKEIITDWKLINLYETKTEMNIKSNECLDRARKQIDIIAIGMSNFLSYKGDVLEKKAQNGVKIRIISCDNLNMLRQREKDESYSGSGSITDVMKSEVLALSEWVKGVARKKGTVNIKYHSSYPGFSYLRIDDTVFFGPNLPLYKSQINFALEFNIHGKGGQYFVEFFESLWNNNSVCTEQLHFKE